VEQRVNHKSVPETEVADRITDVLMVLSDVTSGNFEWKLPDLPDTDAFCVLFQGINEMAATLAEANASNQRYQSELQEKLATIEQQRMAIRELSTPVIEVWDGVLCLPIVGVMDTTRSAEMTESLLRAIVERKAVCAIVDLTGIEIMDTGTVDHFLRVAKAVRLLGAECVVTGISPSIAQTIAHMGLDLSMLRTHKSLRDALAVHVASPKPMVEPSKAKAETPEQRPNGAPADRASR
jgi:rsbT co-antagonist protein RsbR